MTDWTIVIVEDDEPVRSIWASRLELLSEELEPPDQFTVQCFEEGQPALEFLESTEYRRFPGIVLADVDLKGNVGGMDIYRRAIDADPEFQIVLITGKDRGPAIEALGGLRPPVSRFLEKPAQFSVIWGALERALEKRRGTISLRRLQTKLETDIAARLIGNSKAIRRIRRQIVKVGAASNIDVLIWGETGTGKEEIARLVHEASDRSAGPFSVIECQNLTENIAGSELFGHVRGAFTGAEKDRKGLIEVADGGTALLDELDRMPFEQQKKLLRVIEKQAVRRVGATEEKRIDVRFLGTTHEHPDKLVEAGVLLRDLRYRLGVVLIHAPPLRERREDILPIFESFVQEFAHALGEDAPKASRGFQQKLRAHDWLGNAREVRNEANRFVNGLSAFVEESSEGSKSLDDMLRAYEKNLIISTLRKTAGNKAQAAIELGLPRRTLGDRIRRLSIKPQDYKN